MAIYSWLVKEHRFIRAEMSTNGRDNISGRRKAAFAMTDATAALATFDVKPLVNEIEIVTAVVDLSVTVTSGPPAVDDRD